MSKTGVTRREFLAVTATIVATGVVGVSCGGGTTDSQDGAEPQAPPEDVYRLSLRGRRGSRAALQHNANKLFATEAAADQNRAHPGDRSRVVSFKISSEDFNRFFDNGNRFMVDLRHI